jgi:ketosteroid isomerase-like protein
MLKKILLPCLAATVTLATPLSTLAAGNNVKLKPVSIHRLSAKKTSLSAADERAIKKLINDLTQAINTGDSKKYLQSYSTKFQGITAGREKVQTYQELQQGAEMIGIISGMGVTITAEKMSIASTGNNKATIELVYRAEMADSPGLASEKRSGYTPMLFAVEKINGRWLIVSQQSLQDPNSNSRDIAKTPNPLNASPNQGTAKDQQTFSEFFKRHLETLNKKDLTGYLATLDPAAPQYNQAKADTAQLFQEYTLKYSVKSVKVLSIGSTEAVVQMVATVKKVSGGEFKDSKMTTTNVLRKINGKWRIYDTEVNALEGLQAKK